MSSSRVRAFSALTVLLAATLVVVGCCTPELMSRAIAPSGSFDDEEHPPAPDYGEDRAWLALPGVEDDADVAIETMPAIDPSDAPVDVLYLHPTTSVAARWNASFDDEQVRAAGARGGTLIQASAFNATGAVYAPTYRQASGTVFTHPSSSGERALDLAYGDIVRAFESFQGRRDRARPMILAAHSQGAMLGARLLRERLATDDEALLVAAYLVGAALSPADITPRAACSSPDETGCVVTFNARGPGHVRTVIDFQGVLDERDRLCVNPTLGSTSTAPVARDHHGGAVFFDAESPRLLPAFLASRCHEGRLVVTELGDLPFRDVPSSILRAVMGSENHHPIEYQLFYVDLRKDAQRRTARALTVP